MSQSCQERTVIQTSNMTRRGVDNSEAARQLGRSVNDLANLRIICYRDSI